MVDHSGALGGAFVGRHECSGAFRAPVSVKILAAIALQQSRVVRSESSIAHPLLVLSITFRRKLIFENTKSHLDRLHCSTISVASKRANTGQTPVARCCISSSSSLVVGSVFQSPLSVSPLKEILLTQRNVEHSLHHSRAHALDLASVVQADAIGISHRLDICPSGLACPCSLTFLT